jgi:regulator of nucleoside diphosphate kinase
LKFRGTSKSHAAHTRVLANDNPTKINMTTPPTTVHVAPTLPMLRISSADHHRLSLLVHTAMKSQPRLREGLQALQSELLRADVMSPELIPATVVTMGATVEVEDLRSAEVDRYTLVYPEQADPAAGKISILSPIGTAIIGFAVGDVFTWKTPGGERRLRINAVTRA